MEINEVNGGFSCEHYITLEYVNNVYLIFILSILPITVCINEMLLFYVTRQTANLCSALFVAVHFVFSLAIHSRCTYKKLEIDI